MSNKSNSSKVSIYQPQKIEKKWQSFWKSKKIYQAQDQSNKPKKYILVEQGTVDYALMYIPSEAVYYEVVNSSNLFDYASGKRVLPVSPTTFYAYTKAILMSFEGQKIESKAREILNTLRAIQKDYGKVEENLGVLGRHVNNAYNSMSTVTSTFGLLGQKLSQTNTLGDGNEEESQLKIEG